MCFALLLWSCGTAPAPQTPSEPAGSGSCEGCHPEQTAAWLGSHHQLAERPLGPGDAWARELGAVRLIGVEPVVQALIPASDGRIQAHQLAYDPRDGSRFDIFADGRQPGEWGHWTGGGMTWNSRCAACHTTGLLKNYDGERYRTTFADPGVGCAACHGEAGGHRSAADAPKNPRMDDTCASCHSRRSELTGAFVPGERYLDHFMPVWLDDPAVFSASGRALDEAFEWNQLMASPMYTGGARCTSCHDPHSGGLLRSGDALCAPCHPVVEHGEGCVDCHMPTNRLMARHDRRDHGFTWPDDRRYLAFERARTGQGWEGLDLSPPQPGRRAAHLSSLGLYPDDAAARAALRTALSDPDAGVRVAAANALLPVGAEDLRVLQALRDDPVRAVRVASQRALCQGGMPRSEAPDLRAYLDHNADDPNARAERGMLRLAESDPGGLADLAAATRLDPSNPALIATRAVGLSTAGRPSEALAVLQEGLKRFPEDLELRQSLGLGFAAISRNPEAIEALSAVVAADPTRGRVWRNLALLYSAEGQREPARQAAERAVALLPEDAEFAAWAARL